MGLYHMSNVKLVRKTVELAQVDDIKSTLLSEIGSAIDGCPIFNDDVLVATYVAKQNMEGGHMKTAGGIIIPQKKTEDTIAEDIFQGKVGLILKKGPIAFKYDRAGCAFEGEVPDVHDWVLFRPSDGWSVSINSVACRIVPSTMIKMGKVDPSVIW